MKWYYHIPIISYIIDLYREHKCKQELRRSTRRRVIIENFRNNL